MAVSLFSGASDEALTRFRPPRKVPAALCGDPRRPRIEKNALCAFLEVEVPSSSKSSSPQKKRETALAVSLFSGASDEARTRYLHLGKVALYQMSYARRTIVSIAGSPRFVNTFSAILLIFYGAASGGASCPSPSASWLPQRNSMSPTFSGEG